MSNKNCFILSYYRYFEFGIALCFGTYIYIPNLFENALTSITQNALLCTITIGLLQPIAEEMLFRGVVLGCLLKGKTNPWIAIGISTFIFSIIHLNLTQ